MSPRRSVIAVKDATALAAAALSRLVEQMAKLQREVAVCLTGGTTPKHMYAMMAQTPWRDVFHGIACIGSWEMIGSCLPTTR